MNEQYEQFVKDNAAAYPDEETEIWHFYCKKCGGNVEVHKKFIKDNPRFWGQHDYIATCLSCGDVQTGRYPEDESED